MAFSWQFLLLVGFALQVSAHRPKRPGQDEADFETINIGEAKEQGAKISSSFDDEEVDHGFFSW